MPGEPSPSNGAPPNISAASAPPPGGGALQPVQPGGTVIEQLAPTVAVLPRSSRAFPVQLPAATGTGAQLVPAEQQIIAPGSKFYVITASAQINIQPVRAGNIGISNPFGVGQGQPVTGGYEFLTVRNYNSFPVVALVWVGFDDFINNQMVIASTVNQAVTFPTQSLPTSTQININDLSGTAFLDINGKKWYAIQRQAIIISNLDTGVSLLLQKAGSAVANGAAVLLCPVAIPVEHRSGGNFTISTGGATINAIVSEIYLAFAA